VHILALASDYDGTIADDGVTAASTVAALARFKASGKKLIMVTGRPLGELKDVFGHLDLFDIVVAENGGLLYYPSSDTERPLAPPPSEAFVARLRERGVDELAVNRTIVATHTGHHAVIRDTLEEMGGLGLEIILNTDALMVLPAGINKASGLTVALAELSLDASAVAAIGDAENDIVFLKQCGLAVAVGNALPEVKAIADVTTAGARGAGVEEFIASILPSAAA
jgi:HAD superfamily hydrolase (TIGR01484 family)